MNKQRPINLNLLTLKFPITAIVSILHRISGIFLFLCIPFFLWGLHLSLSSEQNFETLKEFLLSPVVKFFVWFFLSAFIYHLFAGIKHLLMDLHIGENLKGSRVMSFLTLFFSGLFIVMAGYWLW
ncbi:succinate dehydrogenase, cytochrome b556 subunit [Gammaproteobacteria bacterium]|nr:succinate dehydrogenase, cytochrome b556 subunit [Gammaproteobacteria bacterium]